MAIARASGAGRIDVSLIAFEWRQKWSRAERTYRIMKNSMKWLLLLSTLCTPWHFANATTRQVDFAGSYSVSNLKISTDGAKVAYTLCAPPVVQLGSHVKSCNLFIIPVNEHGPKSGMGLVGSNVTNFAWSPDNRRLAFIGGCDTKECLFVTDGSKSVNLGVVTGGTLEWLNNTSLIATDVAKKSTKHSKQISSDEKLYVVHGSNGHAHSLVHTTTVQLSLIDVASGTRTVIDKDVASFFVGFPFVAPSPDGNAIAYSVPHAPAEWSVVATDIKVWRAQTGSKTIARNVPQRTLNGELVWSPDATKVAWCGGANLRVDHADTISIYNLRTGTLTAPELPAKVRPCPERRPIAMDVPDLKWVDNGRMLISADVYSRAVTSDRRATAVYQFDLTTKSIEELYIGSRDEEVYILGSSGAFGGDQESLYLLIRPSAGGNAVLGEWKDGAGLKELVSAIPGGVSSILVGLSPLHNKVVYVYQRLGDTPSISIDDFSVGNRRIVRIAPSFTGHDITWIDYYVRGRPRTAALVVPDKVTKESKVMIAVYPILSSSDMVGFADDWPFPGWSHWLKRGDIVLYPDMRVRNERARADIVDDVASAIRAFETYKRRAGLKSCGYYVFGHSAGALATYDLITSNVPLDGAVVTGDFSNWIADFGEGSGRSTNMVPYGPPIAEYSSIGPTGTPWSNREGYRAASPYFDFDKVKTPLLIGHGTADPLDSYHAEAAFISLESLGKDVTLALADGGGHVPEEWSVDERNAFLTLVDRFIADHPPQHCGR